jgi:nickel/cobalt transporter (NiCoT) family protein
VFVALFVGLVEFTQLMAKWLALRGGFWTRVQNLDFGVVGLVIVIAFIASWAGAFAFYRAGHVEERWSSALRN